MSKYDEHILKQVNAFPTKAERGTAERVFDEFGEDILFLAPERISGVKTPDFEMSGKRWEIKIVTGASRHTIENNFRTAINQSGNIIFDLRKSKLPSSKYIGEIKRQFRMTPVVKNLIIIQKNGEMSVDTK
ncbi:MAG: hypothetical protein LBM12_02290 [Candidatus Nomurabacteria bacterium]|jgi:hypothetical protein|nr:hypothetical protein [Candidatus Nomurabacteria bacterium]